MIILDNETTGLLKPSSVNPIEQPRIIDIAMVRIDRSGAEVGRFQSLLNPGVPLDKDITRITGYTDAHLKDAPGFADILPELARFCVGERCWLAHNLNFDRDMVFWELVRLERERHFPFPPQQLCTVQLYEPEFGHRPRLTELYARKVGKPLQQKHTAMADVEALLEVVRTEKLYLLEDDS